MSLATTYHESAHAVLLDYFGFKFDFVTAIPDSTSSGRVQLDGITNDRRFAVAVLAGRIAGAKSRNQECTVEQAIEKNAELCDGSIVDAVLKILYPDSMARMDALAWSFVDAQTLVDQLWTQITSVAIELSERKALSAEEVRAICNPRRTLDAAVLRSA